MTRALWFAPLCAMLSCVGPGVQSQVDVVRADAEGGAYQLGQLLAELGHQRTAVITGLAGTLLVSEDGGESFLLVQQADRQGLATALPTDSGDLVLVGEFGVNLLSAAALKAP